MRVKKSIIYLVIFVLICSNSLPIIGVAEGEGMPGDIQVNGSLLTPDGSPYTGSGHVIVKNGENVAAYEPINNGQFFLRNLADGSFSVVAYPDNSSAFAKTEPNSIIINEGTLVAEENSLVMQFQNPQFQGSVKDSDGVSVSLATVDVCYENGGYIETVVTNSDGEFFVGGLVDGDYSLTARFNYSDEYVDSESLSIHIINNEVQESDITLTLIDAQILGTLYLPDEITRETGGWVEIKNSQGESVNSIQVNSEGEFKIGGLDDGKYFLRARGTNLDYTPSKSMEIDILNGSYTPPDGGLKIYLTESQLLGTVLASEDGVGITANVDILTASGDYIFMMESDEQGSFKVGGLDDGNYKLRANPKEDDTNHGQSEEFNFVIDEGQYFGEPVTLILAQTQLTGIINTPEGQKYSGYGSISVMKDGENYSWEAINNGEFKLSGLDDGVYNITAYPDSDSGLIKSEAFEIVINNGTFTPPENGLILELQSPQFQGIVKNPLGEIEPYANIEICLADGSYVQSVNAGVNGVFMIGDLDDGAYKLRARPSVESFYANSQDVIIHIFDGVLQESNLTLVLDDPQVTGTVYNPEGENVVPWGWIEIKNSANKYFEGVPVDAQGVFKISGLEDGSYLLTAKTFGSGYSSSEEVAIDIVSGEYTPPDGGLKINLTEPQLTGFIFDKAPGGEEDPVPVNGNVDIFNPDNKWITSVGADDEGYFAIGGLPDGTYKLKANPDYNDKEHSASNFVEVIITDGQANTDSAILYLTMPQVTGQVKEPNSENLVMGGFVELKKQIASDDSIKGEKESYIWLQGEGIKDGVFNFGSLEDGIYLIKANPELNSDYTSSKDYKFKILDGNLVPDIETDYNGDPIVLTLENSQIEGVISSPDGKTVKYGWVEILGMDEKWYGGTSANEEGKFKIGDLEDGTYYLVAWPEWGSGFTESAKFEINIVDGAYNDGEIMLNLRSPQLSGEVLDPNGNPVSYGYIDVKNGHGEYVTGIGVDNFGRFSIGGLTDGEYVLVAQPNWDSEFSSSREFKISIIGGNLVGDPRIVLMLSEALISGTVQDPDGNVVDNAYINIDSEDGKWVTGVPANNGLFHIGSLQPGNYIIRACPDWNSDFSESKGVKITIGDDGTYNDEDLVIKLTASQLTGFVKGPSASEDADNFMPYGYIEVKEVIDGDYDNTNYLPGVGINDQGEFKLGNLNEGKYLLKANPGWGSKYSTSAEFEINIDADGNYVGGEPLLLRLSDAQVKGTVKDPNDNLVQFGFCEIFDNEGRWITGSPVDKNGEFKIGGLESNKTYKLRVQPDYLNSDFSASNYFEIQIDGSGNCITNGGEITINLTGVQLSGKVTEPQSQNPCVFGWIEIQKLNGINWEMIGGVGIDQEGNYKIGGLQDGTYRVKAFPNNLNSDFTHSEFSEIVIDGSIVTQINGENFSAESYDIQLSSTQINGRIVGPAGEEIEYGWVEVRNSNDEFITGVGAKEDGSFSLGNIADGTYKIIAYPGWDTEFTKSSELEITIDGGICLQGELNLELKNTQIVGNVLEADGSTPVNWGWVEIYNANNNNFVQSIGIDKNGNFRISDLDDGNYYAIAYPKKDSNFTPSDKLEFSIIDGSANIAINLILKEVAAAGQVYLTDSVTLTNRGWVEIGDSNENWLYTIQINKDGSFNLPELAAGTYTIQAFPKEDLGCNSSNVITFNVNGLGEIDQEIVLVFNE